MLTTLLHHPRRLWVRRALFQVHLWVGILLSLYIVVIALSGSILVFQDELRRASLPSVSFDRGHVAPVDVVISHAQRRFSVQRLTYVGFPQQDSPWWTLSLTDAKGRADLVYADASSGEPFVLHRRLLIDWVLDLHVYLLAGQTGFIVNCLAGIGLLLLALTGAVLWWPGVQLWRRALGVSWPRGWKRVNYDLHSAIGIWTLLIVSWWGITAIYFLMPEKVSAVVSVFSPLVSMKEPHPAHGSGSGDGVASLHTIFANLPPLGSGSLSGVILPAVAGEAVTIYTDRRKPGDFSHRDIFTFDGHTGRLLTVWHYGDNRSLGDWVLWLMYPLHFGTLWGLGIQCLWSLLGIALAVLSATGLLMYWNRKLSKWWADSLLVEKVRSRNLQQTSVTLKRKPHP